MATEKDMIEGASTIRDMMRENQKLRTDLAAAYERAEKAEAKRDHWKKEYHEWEEREAAVCPEDFSFEEVIETLRTQLTLAEKQRDEAVKFIGQTADDTRCPDTEHRCDMFVARIREMGEKGGKG